MNNSNLPDVSHISSSSFLYSSIFNRGLLFIFNLLTGQTCSSFDFSFTPKTCVDLLFLDYIDFLKEPEILSHFYILYFTSSRKISTSKLRFSSFSSKNSKNDFFSIYSKLRSSLSGIYNFFQSEGEDWFLFFLVITILKKLSVINADYYFKDFNYISSDKILNEVISDLNCFLIYYRKSSFSSDELYEIKSLLFLLVNYWINLGLIGEHLDFKFSSSSQRSKKYWYIRHFYVSQNFSLNGVSFVPFKIVNIQNLDNDLSDKYFVGLFFTQVFRIFRENFNSGISFTLTDPLYLTSLSEFSSFLCKDLYFLTKVVLEQKINFPLNQLDSRIKDCLSELRSCYSRKYEYRSWANSFLPQIAKDYDDSLSLYEEKLRFYITSNSNFVNNFSSQIVDAFSFPNLSSFSRILPQLSDIRGNTFLFSQERIKDANFDLLKNSFDSSDFLSQFSENVFNSSKFPSLDSDKINFDLDPDLPIFDDFSTNNDIFPLDEDLFSFGELKDSSSESLKFSSSSSTSPSNTLSSTLITIDDLDQMVSLTKVFSFDSTIDILRSNGFTKSSYILKRFVSSDFSFFRANSRFSIFIEDSDFDSAWKICYKDWTNFLVSLKDPFSLNSFYTSLSHYFLNTDAKANSQFSELEYSILKEKISQLKNDFVSKELASSEDSSFLRFNSNLPPSPLYNFSCDFLNNSSTFLFYNNQVLSFVKTDKKFSKPVLDYLLSFFDFSNYVRIHILNSIKKVKSYQFNIDKMKNHYRSLSQLLVLKNFYNLETCHAQLNVFGFKLFDVPLFSPYFFDFRGRKYPSSTIFPTNSKLCRLLHYYGLYENMENFFLKKNEVTSIVEEYFPFLSLYFPNFLSLKDWQQHALFWCFIAKSKILIKKDQESFSIKNLLEANFSFSFLDYPKLELSDFAEIKVYDFYINLISNFYTQSSSKSLKKYGILKDITGSFIQNLVKLIGEKTSDSLIQVNLLSKNTWYDVYLIILNAWKNSLRKIFLEKRFLEFTVKKGFRFASDYSYFISSLDELEFWLNFFTRFTTKKIIMTKGYSLTLYGAYRYFRESLLKIYNKDLYDFIFIELLLKNFYNYLDKSLETDLFLRVSSDTLLSYYLTKIEKDIFYTTQVSDGHTKLLYVRFVLKRFDSSIYVKTPLGLSKKRVSKVFKVLPELRPVPGSNVLSFSESKKDFNLKKYKLALKPNLNHLYEAYYVRRVETEFGSNLHTIHDCFLVPFLDVGDFIMTMNNIAESLEPLDSDYINLYGKGRCSKIFSIFIAV